MRALRILGLACTFVLAGCGSLLGLGDEPQPQGVDSSGADSLASETDVTDASDADVSETDASEADITAKSCPPPLIDVVASGARAARIAAQSNLVRSCIYEATHGSSTIFATSIVGPYVPCSHDPAAGDVADRRYDEAIAYLRTVVDFPVPCTSHPPTRLTDESYGIASWLAVDHGADPKVIPQVAGLLAHLAMDDRGYEHGGDTKGHAAYLACAPTVSEAAWSSASSMPSIVQSCIEQTLLDSGSAEVFGCTGLTCGPNSMALAQNAKGSTPTSPDCVCVEDPKAFGPPLTTFYDGSTGKTSIARLADDSSFAILAETTLSVPRKVIALPWNLRVFVDFSVPTTQMVRVDAAGAFTKVDIVGGGFSSAWAGVIALPSERTFEFTSGGIGASNKVNPTGFTPTTASFGIRANAKLVTAPSYDTVFLLDTTGTADVGRISIVDGTYAKIKTLPSFNLAWTHLASVGDGFVLFYRSDTGSATVGRIASDGSFTTVLDLDLAKGWDRIATTFDGRFVFYAKEGGKTAVYRMRPNGSLALEHEQTGLPSATVLVVNR